MQHISGQSTTIQNLTDQGFCSGDSLTLHHQFGVTTRQLVGKQFAQMYTQYVAQLPHQLRNHEPGGYMPIPPLNKVAS